MFNYIDEIIEKTGMKVNTRSRILTVLATFITALLRPILAMKVLRIALKRKFQAESR